MPLVFGDVILAPSLADLPGKLLYKEEGGGGRDKGHRPGPNTGKAFATCMSATDGGGLAAQASAVEAACAKVAAKATCLRPMVPRRKLCPWMGRR